MRPFILAVLIVLQLSLARGQDEDFQVRLRANHGKILLNPQRATYPLDSLVSFEAAPDPGYSFWGWQGAYAGTQTPVTTNIHSDLRLRAIFTADEMPASPAYSWVSSLASLPSGCRGIGVDAAGNVYVSGAVDGRLEFGSREYISHGSMDLFVAKFSPTGTCLWIAGFGNGLRLTGGRLAVAPDGSSYLSGSFQGDLQVGSHLLSSLGGTDAMLVKLDTAGVVRWAKRFGGPGDDSKDAAMAMGIDRDGNPLMVGTFRETATLDGVDEETEAGAEDVFVAKYTPAGQQLWIARTHSSERVFVNAVKSDDAGNVFLAGGYVGSITLDGESYFNDRGNLEPILFKLSPGGKFLWSRAGLGEPGWADMFYTLGTDKAGNVYSSGIYRYGFISFNDDVHDTFGREDIFLNKYDASGNLIWVKSFGGKGHDLGWDLESDANGNLTLVGFVNGPAQFGNLAVSIGEKEINGFIARFDTDGECRWIKMVRNGSTSEANNAFAVALDRDGGVHVAGNMDGGADFDGTSYSGQGFVIRITPNPIESLDLGISLSPLPTLEWFESSSKPHRTLQYARGMSSTPVWNSVTSGIQVDGSRRTYVDTQPGTATMYRLITSEITLYSIYPASPVVGEGVGALKFSIQRTGGLPGETLFVSTTQNEGSANNGDYTGLANQAVSFASGESTKEVSISITNDGAAESDERFGFTVQRSFSDPLGVFLARTTFTIQDSTPVATSYSIAPSAAVVAENAGSLKFSIQRTGGLPAETLFVSTTQNEGSANNGDYTGLANQAVSFASGESTKDVSISITNDGAAESDERFGFIVQRSSSDPLGVFLVRTTFTIQDSTPVSTSYSIAPSPAVVAENAGSLKFSIQRTGGLPAETLFVSTTQNEGSANNGDYTGLANQAVSFASSESTKEVSISITNDGAAESDERFGFIVQRSSSDPLGVFLVRTTFTIQDSTPVSTSYSIAPSPAVVAENAGSLKFSIQRTGGLPAETLFVSTTQNEGSANNGDYTGLANQAVSFASGESTKDVTVQITNDGAAEGDERFGFIVQRSSSDPLGVFLVRTTFTIQDSTPVSTSYSIAPSPAVVAENAGSLKFSIQRTGGLPAETLFVSTTQNEGSANNGDYTGLANQAVSFASGESTKDVSISITNDGAAESDERFGFIVQRSSSDPLGVFLVRTTFTIQDNDASAARTLLPGTIHYVRQITRPDMHSSFNSKNACGPCSAVMILSYYNLLPPHPQVGASGQANDYAWYVAPVENGQPSGAGYSSRGFTFGVGTPDVAGGKVHYGAFGYLTQDYRNDPQTRADRAAEYFWKHGLFARFADAATESDVRAEIAAGRPVLLSATFTGVGHIMVIRGYDETGLIAADPWVRAADNLDRNEHKYTWAQLHENNNQKYILKTITPILAGGRVRCATSSLNVRSQPTTSGNVTGALRVSGQLGTIELDATKGSTTWNADSFSWIKVRWDDGVVGWSALGSGGTLWVEPVLAN